MFTLYKKELANFFSSLIGYLTIIVFLVLNGLMLWVFRSDFNILDYGFAGMDGFFLIAPFLYLFLIPAITMRMFAEERKNGTIELLLTKPLTEMTIIWAKFLAGFTLVFISLLPTLICYFSVYSLGDPIGNIDTGAVMGSYIGLLFLGGAFVAIGIFASSLTNNQIISFILSALICAFCYLGFESLYYMNAGGDVAMFLKQLGMRHHYESVSRGVIDTRDLIYFVSVIAIFLISTRLILQSRKWNGWIKRKNLKRTHWFEFAAAIVIIICVNIMGKYLFTRIDLTEEKRFTLSKSTKTLLKGVDETVLFRVYLEGEFPADFKRLQNETKEMLNQFRAYNKYIQYEFVDPNSFESQEEQTVFYQKLAKKGIQPTQLQTRTQGGTTQQIIIPAADVTYRGRETSIQLLQNQKYVSEEQLLNNSIQNLEYVLSNAIRGLAKGIKPKIGFLTGHGELERGNVYDIQMALLDHYRLENITLDGNINALTTRIENPKDSSFHFTNNCEVLVIPKPTKPFSDQDQYILDQYVMYGGKILWLVDPVIADLDSLAEKPQAIAVTNQLNLEDMFFAYGVRLNPDLIMDVRCRPIPMTVGFVGDKPQIQFTPWYYFPEIVPLSPHPIVRNLDLIKTDFISSIDIIENELQKTILLATSEYSRVKNAPVIIDINESKAEPDRRLYSRSNIPVAVLVEGEFTSMWRNRLTPDFTSIPQMGFKERSTPTKMIFISDGDIIKNRFNYEELLGYPMGYDHYTQTMYANKEFILNAINYLAGDEDILASRSKNIELRKLDMMKVKEQRVMYQCINIVGPIILLAIAGLTIFIIRRKKYQKH